MEQEPPTLGEQLGGRRALLVALPVLVTALLTGIVAHDIYCFATWSGGTLCQRPDGTLWRDPSRSCAGYEDPLCDRSGCADSVPLSEGARQSCHWIVTRSYAPAGPPPHFTGPSPGAGLSAN